MDIEQDRAADWLDEKLDAARAMLAALELAYEIHGKHRLAGTDQNPRGYMDIMGSAIARAKAAGFGA